MKYVILFRITCGITIPNYQYIIMKYNYKDNHVANPGCHNSRLGMECPINSITRPGKHTKHDGKSPYSMGKSTINHDFQ